MAPVQPRGWPRAMAPPLTLILDGSSSSILMQARAWEAKALFSSKRSIWSLVRPASLSALGMATVGPIPMISGGQPPTA